MHFVKGFLKQDQLDKAVNEMIPLLGPDVERLKYSVEEDWSGDPAILFKIVLSENASRKVQLFETTRRIQAVIDMHLDPLSEWGLLRYINYRSHSELAARQDKAWA